MERLVSIDSLKIVPHDRRSLAALGMTWGVTKDGFNVQNLDAFVHVSPIVPAYKGIEQIRAK